ncbi:recombinase family protein [Enterobacter cloacae]|uniref:recombinase family protein n=1 Tax=Enterobacter cloacae TaxID=550 RepID=UPI002004B070|nr:recombinase family protein [Enterobacter cloacae]MCK6721040.1 recombinase family protein [Enterobacter cloacae]MCU6414345.1 recombinase family protein [Enterobacter cloacae]HBN5337570.1 recombinase family protein [Enterobacter cloacae]
MAHIAYIRVSSLQQNSERQLADTGITFEKVFTEKVSAKNTNREAFLAMMEYLREGDTLHVHDISRLARNTTDLLSTVDTLTKRGVAIQFHNEGIKTGDNSPTGKLVLTLLSGICQMEREMMLLRQREGYEAAKAAGRIAGRGNGRHIPRTEILAALASGGSVRSVAADFGVSTNTISRIKKEMNCAAS